MHMPPGPPQGPILSCDPGEQLRQLRRLLDPQRWPLPVGLLPPGTVLVGGAVRDALLGQSCERPDLDFVVMGDAVALARDLARRSGGSCVVLDRERSIARLVLAGWSFDLARCCGASLAEDLLRRDYGINAIALSLESLLGLDQAGPIDPAGGLEDLRRGELRALAEANLLADPLRLLRGLRLAGQLGFRLESRTQGWIRQHHQQLATVAGERVLAELERLVAAPAALPALALSLDLGLLEPWGGGGASARGPVALLSGARAQCCGLSAQEAERALPLARLAALLPPESLGRLRASRRLQQRLTRLRHWRQRLEALAVALALEPAPERASPAAAASLPCGVLEALPEPERLALQQQLEEDLPSLVLHLDPAEATACLRRWRDPADPLFHPRSPLDGSTLQRQLQLQPGPILGQLQAFLCAEQAFGRLAAAAEPAQAVALARRWLAERGGSVAASPADGPVA
ncbi:MAG: CCA tRNA nucleotidyltransferase [Cyanobium sp.]